MGKQSSLYLLVVAILALAAPFSWADSYVAGNPSASFANGTFTTNGTIPTSTAPFGSNNPCGADSSVAGTQSCDASWTFTYTPYSSISSASITLGLLGLDSAQPGQQIALFKLTTGSGLDLTAAFENVAEPVADGGSGTNISGRASCVVNGVSLNGCPEYNIYTFDITDLGALTSLQGGSATFHLTLQGPGFTLFGTHLTTNNGAILDFSELDITGEQASSVPEPSSLWLLISGASGVIAIARRRLLG